MSLIRSLAGTRSSSGVRSYWIFEEADNRAIETWRDNLVGDDKLKFYGGFINWCMQQVDHVRDPQTKYKNSDDEHKTRNALPVLREQYPAQQRLFCNLMRVYYKRCYAQGQIQRGIVPDPASENMPAIRHGERTLMEKVWNKRERAALWEAVGNDPAKFDADGKDRRARKLQRRAERRALGRETALEDETALQGRAALGNLEDLKKAIEEAEEEIELQSTAAALSKTQIVPKQAWSEDVADRTR